MKFLSHALAIFAFTAASAVAPAIAQSSADAGMINQLNGEVTYQASGVAAARASAYMKLREGDVLRVPAQSSMRMVYFATGRQEVWRGPAAFTVGAKESTTQAGQPEVSQLPGGVPAKLAQTPDMLQIAKLGRAGSVTVRGGLRPTSLSSAQQAEVAEARKTYETMKAGMAADDIMPEIYFYTVIQNYSMYDEMKGLVKIMQTKQPGNEVVRDLDAWVENRRPK
jgi:hypothetical protein